jgi:hypothetical protein
MKDIIKQLKATLLATRFVVTGSYVMAEYGLIGYGDVKDLDIILYCPNTSTLEIIENLMKESPAKSTKAFLEIRKTRPKSTKPKSELIGIFMINGIQVDIHEEPLFNEPTLLVDGIEYTKINHIVKSKRTIGRMKDLLQLRDWSRLFFRQEEFESILNNTSNWKQALREQY